MGTYVNDFDDSVKRYFKEIKGFKSLTKEEEKKLCKRIRNLDPLAKDELITSNLHFVIDVAKRYKGRGLAFCDLIAEGNIGLLKAFEMFDDQRDVKLISYAKWWIQQTIQEALKKTPQDNDEFPTDELIGEEDDVDMTLPIKNVDDTFLTNENIDKSDNKIIINELLGTLDDREFEIVKASFGLYGDEPQKLDEIGEIFGLSRERIRQIKNTALTKLRSRALEKNICPSYC